MQNDIATEHNVLFSFVYALGLSLIIVLLYCRFHAGFGCSQKKIHVLDIQRTVHRDIFRRLCTVIYSEDCAPWYIQRTVHRDIFRELCTVIYSENCAPWYILIIKPTRCTNFSDFFWNRTLHVSNSSSVCHQESSTVHTALVYVIQVCWLLAWSHKQAVSKPVWLIPLLCLQC